MLVDTNILIDVLNNEPDWVDWSIHQLRVQSELHAMTINPIIYAELSPAFKEIADLDNHLKIMNLKMILNAILPKFLNKYQYFCR
jgi:predicted nucleic acid-binding protein